MEKNYTVYFTPAQIGRDINWDDIHAADAIDLGMLEQVLPDLISWHSLKENEVLPVLNWVRDHFGIKTAEVSIEEEDGCYARELSCDTVDTTSGEPISTKVFGDHRATPHTLARHHREQEAPMHLQEHAMSYRNRRNKSRGYH